MDTWEFLFAGQPVRCENIQILGLDYTHDPTTGWDWIVRCRTYGNQMLYEPQPTLRDAMARLHQITSPTTREA